MRKVKIGLALGSGAARGWSHIGVINALNKMGIDVDIVAGCSIGSLVGSAYACGKLPELETWVRSFSYWDVLRLMDLSWQRGGLLRGERVFNQFRQVMPLEDFTDCQMPFGAVATNLSTGRELWLTEGDIHLAVRASCSMPGLMAPVPHNGYWLVDGGVVNPVPISLTRAMGADIVIAVDLQHDAHLMQQDLMPVNLQSEDAEGEKLAWHERLRGRIGRMAARRSVAAPTAMEIMTTSIQVLENRLKRNRMAGDPPDILIQPYCPQISTLDFHRAEAAIAAGSLAVEKKMDELLPFDWDALVSDPPAAAKLLQELQPPVQQTISHCRVNYRQLVAADQPGLVLDIAPLSDSDLAFYSLDVTRAGDNGVLAALLLRALFNGLLQEQLSHQGQRLPELGSLLKQVNQLFRQANLPGQFPLLVGYYHSGLKNLILVSAGLNASLNTGEHHIEVSNGVPLGTLGTAYLNQISHRCSSWQCQIWGAGGRLRLMLSTE
ncbi:hypothetical protein L1887_42717 [Cichorium endivia]|nr:hypothetical protein L1887_42717 [Cichorium endivia]